MSITPAARHAIAQGALWLVLAGAGLAGLAHLRATSRDLAVSAPRAVEAAEPIATQAVSRPVQDKAQTLELVADARGHFITTAHISGRPVRVLVDTGATTVALRWEDAQAAGIHVRESDFKVPVNTANGITHIAVVTIDSVSLGDIEVRNVQAAVARPGQLHVTLLGMSFLKNLARVDFRGRTLVLSQ